MSLVQARWTGRRSAPPLPGPGPVPCAALEAWAGQPFWMPPGDPRLGELHEGGDAPTPPFDNLVGARKLWEENPEYMEILEPGSPNYLDKLIERGLYLRRWAPLLPPGCRVLDLGGGVGRFTEWLLHRGCEVELVDPDLRSLWRAVRTAGLSGAPGKLDVHWSTGEGLPELAPVDVVIACEVLNYVEAPERVLAGLRAVLKPGGVLLCSVEAQWGWALATDVPEDCLDAFLDGGPLHVPGDRWVRLFSADALRALLSGAGFEVGTVFPSHYTLSGPFEMASGVVDLEAALELEDRLAAHPVAGPLNRAWITTATPAAGAPPAAAAGDRGPPLG